MIHMGDITQISGYDAPAVDVVIGGSPCQDLSIAGKREGLAGERSGLFMEQIRIIREMREADTKRDRTDCVMGVRPRYMVWENVPGALSSTGGDDFRAVLEETARIKDKNAVIPRPPGGKWRTSGCVVGDGWSIAWRILDAQFWGVPQRRRRIALVADFGGQSAPEILFVRKSVCGDIAEGETKGQGVAGRIAQSIGETGGDVLGLHLTQDPITADNTTPCLSAGSKSGQCVVGVAAFSAGQGAKAGGIGYDEKTAPTLKGAESGSNQVPCVCIAGNTIGRKAKNGGNGNGWQEDVSYTLTSADNHAVYDARGNGGEEVVPTIIGIDSDNNCYADSYGTLRAHESGGAEEKVFCGVVRRLTPMECERLQGFPDGWTDIEDWIDDSGKMRKTSDSARYKALGNSIAIPPWKWVIKRLCACYERDATMASLFDGIGGFPLIWEQINGCGSCIWASEIEPFAVAVTRKRFGGVDEC